MNPRRNHWILAGLLCLCMAAGCAEDPANELVDAGPCEDPEESGSWTTIGEPFSLTWCRGCHSRDLPTGSRGGAPLNVNFDTKSDVLEQADRVMDRVSQGTMPPALDLPALEADEFLIWLSCNAP